MPAAPRPQKPVSLALLMTEEQLLQNVLDRVALFRLWAYHTRDSRRSRAGWPDIVVIGYRLLYWELKTETGKPTAEQVEVMGRLQRAGQTVAIRRPSHLLDGTIDRELRELARPLPAGTCRCRPGPPVS